MNEENKEQTRDLSQIRQELMALLAQKKELEKIRAAQITKNESTLNNKNGKQKKLPSLYDKLPVFIVGFGIAVSSAAAILLNTLN